MAVEKVVNLKVNDNIEQTTKHVGSLKTELRNAQNEVNELSKKFGATSDQAVQAAKKAAELKDAIGDAKALTDAFNPDAKFQALTSTLGGVAGGFSAVQGAVGLLGSESQSVEKMILKVQSAMAISQGIQAIGESVDSFKQLGAVIRSTTLFQKALSAATAIQTFVMNGATLAAKALRGALIATGVGALVVGVGLLIANFDKVKKVVMNLVPQLAMVGDVVMSIVNAVTDFVGATSEAERANDRLKASAAASIALNKKYLAEHGSQLDEFTKQKLAAKDKYNEAIQEENADRIALAKELNRELAAIDKARQDEKDKKAKEEQDKKNEEAKKRADDAKKLKEENDKKAKEEKERKDKELQDFETFQGSVAGAKEAQNRIDIENTELQFESLNEVSDNFYNENKDEKDATAAADIAREQAVSDAKKEIRMSELDNISSIGQSLQTLAGKNKALAKTGLIIENAAGLAKIAINTAQAVTKTQATFPGPVGIALSAVNIAAGVLSAASAIKATAKGLQALGGGDAGTPSSISNVASTPAPPQFNIVGQSGTNQLAQTIAGQQSKPIEAFVVSSAVTTSQALDRNRVKTATFGG